MGQNIILTVLQVTKRNLSCNRFKTTNIFLTASHFCKQSSRFAQISPYTRPVKSVVITMPMPTLFYQPLKLIVSLLTCLRVALQEKAYRIQWCNVYPMTVKYSMCVI